MPRALKLPLQLSERTLTWMTDHTPASSFTPSGMNSPNWTPPGSYPRSSRPFGSFSSNISSSPAPADAEAAAATGGEAGTSGARDFPAGSGSSSTSDSKASTPDYPSPASPRRANPDGTPVATRYERPSPGPHDGRYHHRGSARRRRGHRWPSPTLPAASRIVGGCLPRRTPHDLHPRKNAPVAPGRAARRADSSGWLSNVCAARSSRDNAQDHEDSGRAARLSPIPRTALPGPAGPRHTTGY